MTLARLGTLAGFVLVAYAPALTQPLLEDDYPNIEIAQHYGGISGWRQMIADPVFRVRSTTQVFMYSINRLFGMHAPAYYAGTILLQVLNTWLLYAMGAWAVLGYRVTFWAAAFFAVYEGHQEAVMWLSGSTEPLMLFFGLASFVCWVRFLNKRGAGWYAAAIVLFCLALASKESAVVWAALMLPPVFTAEERKRAQALNVQQANREQFLNSFSKGLVVLGYERDTQGNGTFLLGKPEESFSF